jgi:hypothetical protein
VRMSRKIPRICPLPCSFREFSPGTLPVAHFATSWLRKFDGGPGKVLAKIPCIGMAEDALSGSLHSFSVAKLLRRRSR